ncbi:hypothetical protein Tco_1488138 [Tanacetum coccineum]
MGLWYRKGSGFDLTAFSDADHAGCVDTRKSTSGGIQFLGDKLVSWMSKKQDYTAMSSAEAEYVALSASCAQVMWMRTQLQDYAKYALEILKKYGMEKGQSIGTPMATKPKLDADLSGILIDQTDYYSKIGPLMYLTSSRPDIVQAVCYCARYQYPKDSGFKLTAFSDADHAECIDTQKSTSGGIQFLGDKLVSWMSKKQLIEYQLVDMFTKALSEDRFQYLIRRIGMRCLTLAELEVLTNESA